MNGMLAGGGGWQPAWWGLRLGVWHPGVFESEGEDGEGEGCLAGGTFVRQKSKGSKGWDAVRHKGDLGGT
jgi:hypothetical protein